jgi:hypothetical protein
MIYKISLVKNRLPESYSQICNSFIIEWDNQIDSLMEFLKTQGFEEKDVEINEVPILKFSEFRKEILLAKWE